MAIEDINKEIDKEDFISWLKINYSYEYDELIMFFFHESVGLATDLILTVPDGVHPISADDYSNRIIAGRYKTWRSMSNLLYEYWEEYLLDKNRSTTSGSIVRRRKWALRMENHLKIKTVFIVWLELNYSEEYQDFVYLFFSESIGLKEDIIATMPDGENPVFPDYVNKVHGRYLTWRNVTSTLFKYWKEYLEYLET